MSQLASQILNAQKVVTGVQPKLSLSITKPENASVPPRFTLVGLWGEFILKPPTPHYPSLPELEFVTMHLANLAKIETVPFSLIKLSSGTLAYITRRIDRQKGRKIPMEDMCQLTERLTEHKYRGSYEQVAKAIKQHAANPGVDLNSFFELLLFSFLTGNNDAHLKNFSLIKDTPLGYRLAPAYDLVASQLVVEGDDEELALTLNGKKKKIRSRDFIEAMVKAEMPQVLWGRLLKKYQKLLPSWKLALENSWLTNSLKEEFITTLAKRWAQIQ